MVFKESINDVDIDSLLPTQLKHRCKRLKRDLSAARSKMQRLNNKILKLTHANKALTETIEKLKQSPKSSSGSFFSKKIVPEENK